MKKFKNFKVLFAATLFMLVSVVGVSTFSYSSAFAGDNLDELDNKKEAYAVIENKEWEASVTYLYDTEKNVKRNYINKNIEIYPFEKSDWRYALTEKCIIIEYTVDASFINYHPGNGYRMFANAYIINGIQNLNTDSLWDVSDVFLNALV